jgi:hypothetical protein
MKSLCLWSIDKHVHDSQHLKLDLCKFAKEQKALQETK